MAHGITADLRAGGARICRETARWERGERGPLRTPLDSDDPEGSDDEFGVAGAAGTAVGLAIKAARVRCKVCDAWDEAALLLESGWSPGDDVRAMVVGGKKS